MFRRWVALGTAGWVAALGCGERFGEPIVAVPAEQGQAGEPATGLGGAAQAGASSGALAGDGQLTAGGEGGQPTTQGPLGLCAPCNGSDACGDSNDACLRRDEEQFCGRDCEEGPGCPDGYQCVELDNSPLWQCVPTSSCPTPALVPPSLGELREYLLARINAERVARDRSQLAASPCLDELAQASAVDYARTEEPLGKFEEECAPVWPNCSCGWKAEAEVAVAHWGLDWPSAIERALGSDRLIDSFLDFDIDSVGIGFWISGDEAWIALSFR